MLADRLDCFAVPATLELDARGLTCPMPLLKAKQALRNLAPRETLKVLATDAGSVRDFKAYASLSGIELSQCDTRAGVYCYLLTKPAAAS